MTSFKQTNPFTAFGGKIDPLSEIRNAGIVTSGDVYWVKDASDVDHNTVKDAIGRNNMRDGIVDALSLTQPDTNDYVLVTPKLDGGSWAFGTALDISKDRVHLLSVGQGKAHDGYTNMIHAAQGTSTDTEAIAITGNGVELAGFHVQGTQGTQAGGTMSNGLVYINALGVSLHDNYFDATIDGWVEVPGVVVNASMHGLRVDDCAFAVNGTGNFKTNTTGLISFGAGAKRTSVNNSVFSMAAGSADGAFINTAAGVNGITMVEDCTFINTDVTFSPASVAIGSVHVDNPVIMKNCTTVSCDALGTDPTVLVAPGASGTANFAYDPGIATGTVLVVTG